MIGFCFYDATLRLVGPRKIHVENALKTVVYEMEQRVLPLKVLAGIVRI